jgi:hypothetical protein
MPVALSRNRALKPEKKDDAYDTPSTSLNTTSPHGACRGDRRNAGVRPIRFARRIRIHHLDGDPGGMRCDAGLQSGRRLDREWHANAPGGNRGRRPAGAEPGG